MYSDQINDDLVIVFAIRLLGDIKHKFPKLDDL